ncbi:Sensory histidine kinase/phosphatase NtrB [Nymphon striatum]|nr:Sensory histidine kinase/phosphatase NtrB [Nymphon striatum]
MISHGVQVSSYCLVVLTGDDASGVPTFLLWLVEPIGMLFKSRTRVLNKPYSELLRDSFVYDHLQTVLSNSETQTLRGCTLHGSHTEDVTVDCVANPLTRVGKLEGIVLELHRVDHQMRVTREEQLLNQQEATQTLVRGMAHEIKNPLGGLRGAAQLLDSELDSEELKEYTHIIISEADRLQKLVDRMLGSRQPTKYEKVNIHEVLERVRKLVRSDIPEGVELRFDYDPSIPDLTADRDKLIQVVFNIVGNAIKAVEKSGKILFRTRVMRNFTINQVTHRLALKLEIVDDGKGVPDDIRDKLFYPMISGSAQGTGLGLSIAQSLANKHQGVIRI